MIKTLDKNKILKDRVVDLGYSVEEGEKLSSKAQVLVSVSVIKKERVGKYGTPVWPLFMHELVMEKIVNGTSPSSINGNIVAHVRTFFPIVQ